MGIVAEGKLGAAALLHEVGAGAFEAVGDVAGRKLGEQLADGFDGLGGEGAAQGELGDEGGVLVGQGGGKQELVALHASAMMTVEPLASWQASRKSSRALKLSASSGCKRPPWRRFSKRRRWSVLLRLAGALTRSQNSTSSCVRSCALGWVRVVFIGFLSGKLMMVKKKTTVKAGQRGAKKPSGFTMGALRLPPSLPNLYRG